MTQAQIDAASSRELREKLEEYETQSTKLLEHFTMVHTAYELTEASYESVFAKVDSIQISIDFLITGRPGVEAGDAFEELLKFIDIGKYASFGGGAFGFLNTVRKLSKYIKARNIASRAGAISKLAVTSAQSGLAKARAAQIAGHTKDIMKIRRGAMFSGAFSTLVSGAGIALMVHEENLLKKQFGMNLPDYADWFEFTETKVVELCAITKVYRQNLEGLKAELDIDTAPMAGETLAQTYARTDLLLTTRLNEIGQNGGEFQAIIESASRALCLDVPVADVLLYSGLPTDPKTVQFLEDRQAFLLFANKAECKARYPELNL